MRYAMGSMVFEGKNAMTPSPISENDDEVIGGLIGGAGGDLLEYSVCEDLASAEMLSSAKNRLGM